MPRWITAAETADLLAPGMTVFVAGSAAEPRAIGHALRAQPAASAGVTYVGAVLPGARATPFADLHPQSRLQTCMLTPGLRALTPPAASTWCRSVPRHLRLAGA